MKFFHSSFSKTVHAFLIAIAKLKFKQKITKTFFIRSGSSLDP